MTPGSPATWPTVRVINDRLLPLHDALFCETSPGPVKYAASLLGLCEPDARLPICEIADSSKRQVESAMRHAGLSTDLNRPAADRTMPDGGAGRPVIQNRRARHEYFIDEVLEAGIVLQGTEVKSLRQGKASIAEAYAGEQAGALTLFNATIPVYENAGRFNHAPKRPRSLLVHARERNRLLGLVRRDRVHAGSAPAVFQRARDCQGPDRRGARQAQGRQAPRTRSAATGSANGRGSCANGADARRGAPAGSRPGRPEPWIPVAGNTSETYSGRGRPESGVPVPVSAAAPLGAWQKWP